MRFQITQHDSETLVFEGQEADTPQAAYDLAHDLHKRGVKNIEIKDTAHDPHTLLGWEEFGRSHGLDA
jgi:hypothetical protein